MSQIDSYLDSLGINIEDLAQQVELQSYSTEGSESEIRSEYLRDLILDKYSELESPEDKAKFEEELRQELAELMAQLDDLIDQTSSAQYSYGRQNDERKVAEAEKYIQELTELLELLSDLSISMDDVVKYDALVNYETEDDASFSYDTAPWDEFREGEVITITSTADNSGSSSIFASTEEGSIDAGMADTDGDGVGDTLIDADADGVADFDVNGDGTIDYDDLHTNDINRDPSMGQNLYFNLNEGDTVSLASYEDGTPTFKVTREDGTSFFVKVEGDFNIKFYGDGNYITPDEITSTFPKELTMRIWDGADTESWYNHLYKDDVPAAERIQASASYRGVADNLDDAITLLNTYLSESTQFENSKVGDLTGKEQTIQDMLELLYSGLDSEIEMDLNEAWEQVFQMLESFSEEDQGAIVGALLYSVAAYDQGNMQALFYAQSEKLRDYIYWSTSDAAGSSTNLTAFDKFITLILEDMVGTVNYPEGFLQTVFSSDGQSPGDWYDKEENAVIFSWYDQLAILNGVPVSEEVKDARLKDQSAGDYGQKQQTGSYNADDSLTISDAEKNQIKSAINKKDANSPWDGITKKNYEAMIEQLVDAVVDGYSFEMVANNILRLLSSMKGTWQGDVAAGFIYYLNQVRPDLVNGLMEVEGFSAALIAMIEDEKKKPERRDEALSILS